MFHPRADHRGHLGARTRAGFHAAGYRCCRVVHGNGWRGAGSYLDQRLGVAGTRRHLAAWQSWHCAGTGLALFGLFRPRARGRFVAGSLNLAVLFVRALVARRAARRLMAIGWSPGSPFRARHDLNRRGPPHEITKRSHFLLDASGNWPAWLLDLSTRACLRTSPTSTLSSYRSTGIGCFAGQAIFARFVATGQSHIARGVQTRHYRGWRGAESNMSSHANGRLDHWRTPRSNPIYRQLAFFAHPLSIP